MLHVVLVSPLPLTYKPPLCLKLLSYRGALWCSALSPPPLWACMPMATQVWIALPALPHLSRSLFFDCPINNKNTKALKKYFKNPSPYFLRNIVRQPGDVNGTMTYCHLVGWLPCQSVFVSISNLHGSPITLIKHLKANVATPRGPIKEH